MTSKKYEIIESSRDRIVLKPVKSTPDALSIERYYHDNEPVQGAAFEIKCSDMSTIGGNLDNFGKAKVCEFTSTPVEIRFSPDIRDFAVINQKANPYFKVSFTEKDVDTIVSNATSRTPVPPENKNVVLDSIDWVWGTLKGNFNEKQTVSQIIVDAIIGMIPVVGDVTAVRDIIAVVIGLCTDEKKREDKFQWIALTLLLFALIPVVGGAIKGIGKLLIKNVDNVAKIADLVHALNRIGVGDAVKFVKELDLTKYTTQLIGKWHELIMRMELGMDAILKKLNVLIPDAVISRIQQIKTALSKVKTIGDKMIPDAVKELQARLRLVQQQMYDGEWLSIPKTLKSSSREIEAHLVTSPAGKKWEVNRLEFPPAKKSDYHHVDGWPNLEDVNDSRFVDVVGGTPTNPICKYKQIESFSGPIIPVTLPPGTKIYRVITSSSNPTGTCWVRKLPPDGIAWRNKCAVLSDWSHNGVYIEYIVEKPGLKVWEGKIASQIDNDPNSATFGQYLSGGETQLVIDFKQAENKAFATKISDPVQTPRKPTNWNPAHINYNVPPSTVTVQLLKAEEIAPKGNLTAATAARTLPDESKKK
jgi:hypothetical protein